MSAASIFPITPLLPQIVQSLTAHARLVLEAPPGAGKTTQVPLALLDAGWLAGQKILLLEPRRIAARSAAQFMAQQHGDAVGQTVGYRIRFESNVSAATRIEVITEGILTRLIQSDPELTGVGAIIFDEFHERHLAGDLGAALALDVQATLRADLRLLVMSATLDGERVATWLDAPRISSPGRSFVVRIEHPPARTQEAPEQHLTRTVRQALIENEGDILAFLPGRREIARAQVLLQQALQDKNVELVPLHGELSLADQQRALAGARDAHTRRVVLATNVAESSVTLPGIRAVIDSGLAREPRFDPNTGFSRLQTVSIAQSSADQRAGRAGRVAPGTAYRLWPQSRRLEASRVPEIAQAELSSLALELAAWGVTERSDAGLPWLDAPPAGALAQARDLLRALNCLDPDGLITALGRRALALGAPPRLAAAALAAPPTQRALMADLLALMEARSPLRGEQARSDDFRLRAQALHAWRDRRRAAMGDADAGALRVIDQASAGWYRRLDGQTSIRDERSAMQAPGPSLAIGRSSTSCARDTRPSLAIGDLLLAAFPDRIAHQDKNQPLRYTLVSGRGARLHEQTALLGEPWLVVLDLRQEARDSLVLAAAPFDPAMLERDAPQRFTRERTLRWNETRSAVDAFEQHRFGAIVLEERSVPVTPEDALPALLAAVRSQGPAVLPWSDRSTALRQRVQALRGWMPELGLPDLSDAALLDCLDIWLTPALAGKRGLNALSADELAQALLNRLDYAQRQQLDTHAPASLRVPSGQQRALDYPPDAPPVLAVKLQELFGLADTPRVAGGRVSITLHLLSPAGRPIQVTQDLRGFWERTYPEVKKELKGRYPRHPWPDDPWTAQPTHRAKPRGT